jgi:filamin
MENRGSDGRRSSGYIDARAADLGAIPMRGRTRDEWLQIQMSTFINWVNDRLSSSSRNPAAASLAASVTDLETDFQNGILLIRLLETLTHKKIQGVVKDPIFTAHKIANLDLAFKFMKSENVHLTAIGSQNLHEGNLKLTMGLIWTLIQHYQISLRNTRVSAKEVMLNWIHSLMPTRNINNFTSSWTDGMALLFLIHEIIPDKVPTLSNLNPNSGLSNCTLAIRTAKNHLNVPPIITPEDLFNGQLDDKSMMTYLSYFVKPASKAILKWVNAKIPHMKVSNLTTDWNNGIVLAALLNATFPGLFPKWKALQRTKGVENIQQVFDIAKANCGIEPNISAAEMADPKIEELHVMTYVLLLRHGNLISSPEAVIVSVPNAKEAKLGQELHISINATKAGVGHVSYQAKYQDNTPVKCSLTEKRPKISKLTFTPEKSGTIQFQIYWSDVPIPDSPIEIYIVDTNLVKVLNHDLPTVIHTNLPVEVKLDATQIGSGVLTARLMYTDHPPIHPTITDDNGIYTVAFTPINVGTPTLRFYWNKEELDNCAIQYTIVDTSMYKLINLPEKSFYCTFEPIKLSVKSTGGLSLQSLKLVAICDDIHIAFDFTDIVTSGDVSIGEAEFVPTLPGTYRLEIVCIDRLVEGSPLIITVVDPSKCILETKVPKYLAINREIEFLLSFKEAGPGEIKFKCIDNDDVFDSTISSQKMSASVVVTPKVLGEFMITFFHCNHEIPGCPMRVIICDPSSCAIAGDVLQSKSALVGKPVFLSLTNPHSNNITPVIKVEGTTARYPVTIDTGDDESQVISFTPWELGDHHITVTLGGYDIPNSPFPFQTFTGDTSTCSATGSGLNQAIAGRPAQFVVHARSGLLEEGSLNINVQSVVHDVDGKVRARDNNNGSYNVAYLVSTNGAHLVNIKAWGKHIPGSPFKVNVREGPQAGNCLMHGEALNENAFIKIGDPITFSVDTRKGGTGKLDINAIGPRGAQARVFMANGEHPGLYEIQLDPIRPGKYRVSAKWSGQHIPESPFLLRVYPGADASKCKAYGPGLEDGVVGRPGSFTIETRDAGSGVLKVRLNGVRNVFKVDVKPVSSQDVRTLLAHYHPNEPGDYLISIKWSEKDIPGSPFRIKIKGSSYKAVNEPIYATPDMRELDTIPEEFDDDGAPDHLNSNRRGKTRSHFPPTNTITADEMPRFSNNVKNYRENFAMDNMKKEKTKKKNKKANNNDNRKRKK